MTPVELKEALHNGGPVFGTLIVSPSPFWPAMVSRVESLFQSPH